MLPNVAQMNTPKRKAKKQTRGILVRKRKERDCWEVRWREADGTQRRKTFTSLETSESFAKELDAKRRVHGTAALRGIDSESWKDMQTLLKVLNGASISQMITVWERHKGEVLGGEADLNLSAAVTRFLALIKKETVEGANYDQYELHLERLTAVLGEHLLVAISSDQLREFFANLHTVRGKKVRHAKGWTLIHHQKSVRALFARAKVEGWRADDPMEKVRQPAKPKKSVVALSPEDGAALLKANAHSPVSMRLALEMFGGMRYSGTNRLAEKDIDWAAKGIRIPDTKSKDGKPHYQQGFPENMWAWLTPWRGKPQAWVQLTKRQAQDAKSDAFTLAKVKNPRNILRDSFCTYMIADKKDAALCAYLMQHRAPSMLYLHYRGVATEADAALWFAINPT
jgi:integrase